MRVLIAGVGSVLRQDDGFGPAVLEQLKSVAADRPGVVLFEAGTSGMDLVAQLVDGYDAAIIIDAMDSGASAGTVTVFEPDLSALSARSSPEAIDPHHAGPYEVLRMAAALNALPSRVWVVGCQPLSCAEFAMELSAPVRDAVPVAVARVELLLDSLS